MMVANISEKFLKLYILNPFVGLFSLYRIAFLKGFVDTLPSEINILYLSVWTFIVCLVVLLLGFLVFKKYEPKFSDLI
jgi:ABC-type polysaccharide/polyol phosphate export permease